MTIDTNEIRARIKTAEDGLGMDGVMAVAEVVEKDAPTLCDAVDALRDGLKRCRPMVEDYCVHHSRGEETMVGAELAVIDALLDGTSNEPTYSDLRAENERLRGALTTITLLNCDNTNATVNAARNAFEHAQYIARTTLTERAKGET